MPHVSEPESPVEPRDPSGKPWFPLLIIGLLLAYVLVGSLRKAASPAGSSADDIAGDYTTALERTKDAYLQYCSTNAVGAPQPLANKKKTVAPRRTREIEEAIAAWRAMATPQHPTFHRELGLSLAMFGMPDALKTLVKSTVPPPVSKTKKKDGPTKARTKGRSERLDRTEEAHLWLSLFSTAPFTEKSEVARFEKDIRALELGWFEHTALHQLYMRAGMKAQAEKQNQDSTESVTALNSFRNLEVTGFLIGLLFWIAAAIRGLLWLLDAAFKSRAQAAKASLDAGPETFSYSARTSAFAVYLGSFLFIVYLLRVAVPLLDKLPYEAEISAVTILEILIYLPVLALTLFALTKIHRKQFPESNVSMRDALRILGLRSQNVATDIWIGIRNYLMLLLPFILISLLSAFIFKGFHTPNNPVQMEAGASQLPINKALMLIQAAVAAPFMEELMFRGLLMPALMKRWRPVLGICITSAVFALLHPNLPGGFLPLWALGTGFAVSFRERNSLVPSMVMHAMHNAFVTIVMFMVFGS